MSLLSQLINKVQKERNPCKPNRMLRGVLIAVKIAGRVLLKISKLLFFTILPITAFLCLCIVPFMREYIPRLWAGIIWVASAAVFLLFCFAEWLKERKGLAEKRPLDILSSGFSFVIAIFFGSIFWMSYYDTGHSIGWALIITTAIAGPILLLNMYRLVISKKHYNPQEKKAIRVKYLTMGIFYLLVDAFFAALLWKTILFQFVAGGLCMVIIFVNLGSIVISGKVRNKWLVIQDFAAGISLTIYLIYIIPGELQDVVLAIISAVYGGLITLVGVAWTIKDGHRREAENKRLEKIPYFQAEVHQWNIANPSSDTLPQLWTELSSADEQAETTGCFTVRITNIGLGIADHICCKWRTGEKIKEHRLPITLLRRDGFLEFKLLVSAFSQPESFAIQYADLIFSFTDLLGNQYEQILNFSFASETYGIRIHSYKMDSPSFVE